MARLARSGNGAAAILRPRATLKQRAHAPQLLDAVEPCDEPKMLFHGEILEKMRFVGHERQTALRLDRVARKVVARDANVTSCRPENARQRAEGGRFSCAVRPNQTND